MKSKDLILQKIDNGIKYIQDLNEKLDPVISFLEKQMIEKKEELDAKDIFEYYLRLQELKVNSLLIETKMREVLDYNE